MSPARRPSPSRTEERSGRFDPLVEARLGSSQLLSAGADSVSRGPRRGRTCS